MKIKLTKGCFLPGKGLLLIIMRAFIFLFCATVFALTPNSLVSQHSKIKISADELLTVDEVFDLIMEQTEYKFFYEEGIFTGFPRVPVQKGRISTNTLLKQSLSQGNLNIEVTKNNAIIIKVKSPNALVLDQQSVEIQVTISGTITDENNQPLPGANVLEKGTSNGVTADFDGNFTMDIADENAVLVVSYLGFSTKEVFINGQSNLSITLEESAAGLDEVVVVGYGTQKKSDVTGALVSVSSEDITSRPVSNAVEAMQGKAAGVDISTNERPGQVGSITIRGVRSLSASNSPLYVLDGIPLISGGIGTINPGDIESIDILKDASATAIYGSRGANGVVIITTKKGKTGRFTLGYSTSVTAQNIHEAAPSFNAGEYVDFRRWSKHYENPETFPRGDEPTIANDAVIFPGDDIAFDNILRGWSGGTWDGSKLVSTDWTDFVTQTGYTTIHSLSASGGSEKIKAYGSFGVTNNTGTVLGQSYKRYNANVSVDITPTEWFSFGGNINTSFSTQEYGQSQTGNSGLFVQNGLYESARAIFQYALPYDDQGNRVEFPGGDIGVKTIIDEEKYSQNQRTTLRAFASLYAQLDFGSISKGLEGLKYRVNFGPDITSYRDGIFLDSQSVIRTGSSYASLYKSQQLSYTLDNLLLYNKTFGKHDFGATLLQSQTQYNRETSSMAADNIPLSSQKWNALSSQNVALADWDSSLQEQQLLSYMARFNYGYSDKYLLTVSGRYDGASQLADGNKWSFFPSAALGWRLDKENFLVDTNWINQLKLRIGVGATGNAAIQPYSTKGSLSPLFYPMGSVTTPGVQNALNSNGVTQLANNDLGWEKTTQYNYGLDFSIFKGRISGSLDFYNANTTDLLLLQAIPTVTGFEVTFSNIGETKTRGLDLTLNTVNVRTEDFTWSTDFSGSWQENEIVALANGEEDDLVNQWFIGESQNVTYNYESNGIWQESDAAEMAKFNANGHTFSAGNARPVDQNGDYVIDANNDRVIVGNEIPKFIVGLTNTFNYKGFELSAFVYGRMDYLYNSYGEDLNGRENARKVDYYTEADQNSEYQKPIYAPGRGDVYSNTLGYHSGSFMKVRNVSLGYNVPQVLTDKIGLSKLHVYVQAANPGMLFSKVDWIDLDVRTSTSNRGFTLGMNVEF